MTLDNAQIDVRRVETEDSDWKQRFAAFYGDYPMRKHILKRPHAYFAAYDGREIVGHCVIYREAGKWIMDGLRVKAEFRQQGIAKALTRSRIRYAIDAGAEEIWYSCDDENLVTICCHLRLGFKKVCSDPRHRASGHWYRLKVTKNIRRFYSTADGL